MARDFEDIHDLDDLSDDELRELVRSRLAENNTVDIDDLAVEVRDGRIVLGGRVGTDGERLVAEHVVTDVLGLTDVENNIFVDPIRRAVSPEAVDEHLVADDRVEGLLLGDRPVPINPEAERADDNSEAEVFGTTDVGQAIADGTAWIPPESPTQEGMMNTRNETSEDH